MALRLMSLINKGDYMGNSADAALKAALAREKAMKGGASMEEAYKKYKPADAALKKSSKKKK